MTMQTATNNRTHRTAAVHARRAIVPDADFEIGLAAYLRAQHDDDALLAIYARFIAGENDFDHTMRRAVWRAMTAAMGHGVTIASGATFRNPETIRIGDSVFIGSQTILQGCHDGRCEIGNHVWIGPQSYFDARDLVIEDHVGWGPGAKVLGSTHTGIPTDVPFIKTDLECKPVRIGARADIGVNAIILPGVTVGEDSIVGAGAVVAADVAPQTVVAGVPARVLRQRDV